MRRFHQRTDSVPPASGSRRPPTRLAGATGAALVGAAVLTACSSEASDVVTFYYPLQEYVPGIVEACNEATDEYRIVHRTLPRDADGQREQMVRRLAAEDSDLDVLGLDVTWVPEFAEAQWLEEWTGPDRAEATEDVLEGPLETAMWDDKLYGATLNTNVHLLWYDESLTPEPPESWEDMIAMSKQLKEQGEPYEILFTGAQYEGLVVNYNSIVASAGGQILSEDGSEVVMDDGATRGLELLKEVVDEGLVNPSLTNAEEQQVDQAFSVPNSNAAFQINWPYAYAATQETNPDRGENLAWTAFPGVDGEEGKPTVGGFNLGVSSYSDNKQQAFDAAKCLRNADQQKYAAICGGVPPTIEALYRDTEPIDPCDESEEDAERPSMETAYPMRETILESLQDAAVRPLTPVYQNLSTVTSKVLSPPSDIDPESTAAELRDQLDRALESQGVLP